MFLDYLSIKLMIFSRVSSLLEQSTILFHALSRMKAAALTLTSPMSAILIFGLCSGELWSWLVRIISMMLSRLAALQSQWGCEVWELSGRRDLPGTLASSRLQSEISLELLTTVTRAGPEEDSDSRQLSLSSLSFKPEIKDLSPSKLDFLCWWRTRK